MKNQASKTKQSSAEPNFERSAGAFVPVDFYRAIPKFYRGDQNKIRIQGKFLRQLDREFLFNKQLFQAIITPGRIKEQGEEIEFHLGEAEEQVEEAIWTLAADYRRSYPHHLSDPFDFSVDSIQAELTRRGLHYSTADITRAVKILNSCRIRVQPKNPTSKGTLEITHPINLLEIQHRRIITYRMDLNPYFMKFLKDGNFQPYIPGN